MIIVMLLSSGCSGSSVVRETAVPTETAAPAVSVAEIPLTSPVLELPDFRMPDLMTDPAADSEDEGNFCLADETAAADQDCDPSSAEGILPDPVSAENSGINKEVLPNFLMQDLDGKEVRLGDLILGNKVTMLNVWGISCGPCMTEMPELTAIRKEFAPQGLEIVGLASDLLDSSGKIDPSLMEAARTIVSDLGVDYPILAMTKDIRDQMGIFATPTTYLVDSSGILIGDAVMGTRNTGEWKRIIKDALQKAG